MKNLTKKQEDIIAQQLAEFFYECFERRDFKERTRNNLSKN